MDSWILGHLQLKLFSGTVRISCSIVLLWNTPEFLQTRLGGAVSLLCAEPAAWSAAVWSAAVGVTHPALPVFWVQRAAGLSAELRPSSPPLGLFSFSFYKIWDTPAEFPFLARVYLISRFSGLKWERPILFCQIHYFSFRNLATFPFLFNGVLHLPSACIVGQTPC